MSPTGLLPSPAGLSHTVRLNHEFVTPRMAGRPPRRVPQPPRRNPCRVSHATGLGSIRFRSPLLTESLLFSLPEGTEMFHFPSFPPPALYIQAGVTPHNGCRVPPFGHPRITARLTAPRGLSRPPTSFIGSWCQGIHHTPLTIYYSQLTSNRHQPAGTHFLTGLGHQHYKMLASTIQFTNTHQPTNPSRHPPASTTPSEERPRTGMSARLAPGAEDTRTPTPPKGD